MLGRPIARISGLAAGLLMLAACSGSDKFTPPPRADDPVVFETEPSTIAVDLTVDLGDLEQELERAVPRTLWEIHRKDMACVPSKKVDLALFKVKSPTIKCDIDGVVTRGRMRLSGRGRELLLTVPINGTLRAHDIAGVLKGETATGAAEVTLAVKINTSPDWRIGSEISADYRWSREPGIDFLGRRIKFTGEADKELAPLRQKLTAEMERALARKDIRSAIERGWRAAHTVVELNEKNPPVWGRISPQSLRSGGYNISGKTLTVAIGVIAELETFIGDKPEAPKAPPLPKLVKVADTDPGKAVLRVPVIADYAVLEPVILKALKKRSARPFVLGEYGNVTARFDKVVAYGTEDNKVALGVTFAAESDLAQWAKRQGTLFVTARPANAPNSRLITFSELEVSGETDMMAEQLLFALVNSPEFGATIADALKQNFENDFNKLRGKIDRAIAQRKDGPLAYSVKIERIETGVIKAFGQGLLLPVEIDAGIKAQLVKAD